MNGYDIIAFNANSSCHAMPYEVILCPKGTKHFVEIQGRM